MFDRADSNPILSMVFISHFMGDIMEEVLKNEELQKFLKTKQHFDVVIVEQFMNDAQKALSTHFNAPLIIFSTVGANSWINPLVGNPSPLSYIPESMLDYSYNMTFFQRVVNTITFVANELISHCITFPRQNKMLKQYFPNAPELDDVLYNASLVLLNGHSSLNQPVPYVPNMIDIGGFHIKPPKKLPEDLQTFLDEAKDGVIYFSMGSNLKSAEFPIEKREAFLKTFAKLKQKVLWKWEEDNLPGQPPNVKLSKWLPQQDILAHPNVKLFITHGGFLSTTETIYHGVPTLAIPIFGDQKLNAKRAVHFGYGLTLPYVDITEDNLTKKITELLNNPRYLYNNQLVKAKNLFSSYRNNAKKRSQIFHDRLVGPLDTAVYWVEYVARHKGAPHLRVAGLELPWYKYHLLDVIGFVSIIVLSIIFIIRFITKKLVNKLCNKKKQKLKKQ